MEPSGVQRWVAVSALAASRYGRVHVRDLGELGLSKGAIDKAVRSGRLHREHIGVYVVGHRAPSRHGRWMGCVLACGEGAVLSHRSAAALWRLRDGEGSDPDVTVPVRSGRRRPGVAVHRIPLHPDDVACCEGIPVTSVARTLVDLARVLRPSELRRAVREAQYLRRFVLADVEAALARRPNRRLALIVGDMTPSTSHLEDDFLRLLDRHGVPRPQGQQRLLGHRVDFLWPHARVVAELDGAQAHTTADAFQRDRAQTNVLQLAGYLVLRFTSADVRRRPARVAALVREALGV